MDTRVVLVIGIGHLARRLSPRALSRLYSNIKGCVLTAFVRAGIFTHLSRILELFASANAPSMLIMVSEDACESRGNTEHLWT